MPTNKLALFEGKKIRKIIHNDEWWFSVIDVITVLTDSDRPRKYWSDLKQKLMVEGYIQLSENIGQLKLEASDGKTCHADFAKKVTLII